MVEILSTIAVMVGILGVIIGITYKFYRDSKKDNTNTGFSKGKIESTINYIKEELTQITHQIQNIEGDIEKGHVDYDSIQKQIASIRERLARIEGPN